MDTPYLTKVKCPLQQNFNTPIEEKFKDNKYTNKIYNKYNSDNKHYSNKDIDRTKSHLNYSLKDPEFNYVKEFDKILKKYDLKGQIKIVSNIACEYMITSDNDFFKRIGEEETKRYFATAYKFVCEYKDLGKKYILSAKVHYDEKFPHMHLLFLPVFLLVICEFCHFSKRLQKIQKKHII